MDEEENRKLNKEGIREMKIEIWRRERDSERGEEKGKKGEKKDEE